MLVVCLARPAKHRLEPFPVLVESDAFLYMG
jgi:hypothetical protein